MSKKLTNVPQVSQISDSNSILGNFGGALGQIPFNQLRQHLNDNDEEVLNSLAFYIDVNKASSLGSTRVDVGGNMNMRKLWEDADIPALMDANGNYCELNRNDCRYTAEGEAIVDMTTGSLLTKWANCDVMVIIPMHYGRVQTITIGSNTVQRLWLSLVPLPGGFVIPQQVVGKFKCKSSSSKLRSIPNETPTGLQTINAFFNLAQARSLNHGLANLDFRNHLLFYMMSKYGWRDSQGCKSSDGTLIWGVGLDGTEGLTDGQTASNNGFSNQSGVKTGHTLSLGMVDGKVAVTLANGNTAHGVNVHGFENPWGQCWEMVQGLCSVGTDVYFWRNNWLPTGTPTANSFTNVETVKLTRPTSAVWGMNIITSDSGQGVYMIPKQSISGISYNDYFSYAEAGQLWLWGGYSSSASNCGLAFASSNNAWSASDSAVSARLAYYGDIHKVSANRLSELVSA